MKRLEEIIREEVNKVLVEDDNDTNTIRAYRTSKEMINAFSKAAVMDSTTKQRFEFLFTYLVKLLLAGQGHVSERSILKIQRAVQNEFASLKSGIDDQ